MASDLDIHRLEFGAKTGNCIAVLRPGYRNSKKATDVNIRLIRLDELWEKYGETLVEIKCHEDYTAEDETYNEQRLLYSSRYYRSKSSLTDKATELQGTPELNQSTRANDSTLHGALDHVRLPQIKLQTFNGDIDEWISFRDLFTSLIHWRTDLPEVEKLHYLKGCLQGEPKALIDPLKITQANYQIAWDTLLKRYNNSKQLKKRQVQSLFSLPSLSKESISNLHVLVEGFERAVPTLDQVVQPAEYKDLLLVNLTNRLDPVTHRGWEEFSSTNGKDSLKDLTEFLQRRIRVLESLPTKAAESRGVHSVQPQSQKQKQSTVKTSYSTMQSSSGKRCVACKENHFLFQCAAFQRMSVVDRDALLKTHSLCRSCFKMGHMSKECQSKFNCRNCKGRHHTLVCFRSEKDSSAKVAAVARGSHPSIPRESSEASEPSGSGSSQVVNMTATDISVSGAAQQYSSQVLLATAVVVVEDDEGGRFPARALLDSGSESNFITERLSQRMKTHREKVDISVRWIGQSGTKVRQKIQAVVRSRVSQFSQSMSFLILPSVTVNLPTATINTDGWSIPPGIKLADPAFFESGRVDMVLGIESFFDFFETSQRKTLGNELPTLNESVFGWVVCGGLSNSSQDLRITCNASATENLESLVARFWSSEEVGPVKVLSPEEKRCEDLFQNTVQRNPEGRYTVTLPKEEDAVSRLGESKEIAIRRLQGTERRLGRNANLHKSYHDFLEEYESMGHMVKVEGAALTSQRRCFLPHHPVFKEDSTTTKVRVVFDASCATSSGVSLNNVLLTGPVIQDDLRSIIMRSRTKQIMLVSDVEKVFRQIWVHPEDRPLQCILWRSNPQDEINVYELKTVTYGTKPAPYLATRTLKQLAMDEEATYPLGAAAANSVEQACELRKQLSEMTERGGFRLRKWASNCSKALEGLTEDNLAIREVDGINLDPDPSVKTLGLTWMPRSDQLKFKFDIPAVQQDQQFTKREVLSIIATLFDPLGLLGATITTAKIVMQLLWKFRDDDDYALDWDQPISSMVGEVWRRYLTQLPLLNEIRIDRCVVIPNAVTTEIHCFSDASEKAYGCCIYLRSVDAAGRIRVRLLSSKSRVAPLKCLTIPRLELCGAVLSAQLFEKVQESLKFPTQSYFWTDSTCVLRWIQAAPTTWTTYVANRVAKIHTLTNSEQWRHVPGKENPADLISRGIMPKDIIQNEFWWRGPQWLEGDSGQWPNKPESFNAVVADKEKRRTVVVCTSSPAAEFNDWYLGRSSSYIELVRRTAYWLRYIKLLRTPKEQRNPLKFLTTVELREAEFTVVRMVQKEFFVDECKALAKREAVQRKSPLRWFSPYISEDQVIRVGGRLRHSEEAEDTKHPMVLPAGHHLTKLILRYYHEKLLHAGPQLLLAAVRERFWPLGGRNVARNVVHRCMKCFRSKPTSIEQFMGELPAARVTVSRPFSQTGVDYCGPFYVRPAPRRPAVKMYVAVFICLYTKAVHLELVSDLTTDRFIQALRRFTSRRGKAKDMMYFDNETNFVGARNKLRDLYELVRSQEHQERIVKHSLENGTQWHFNPPSAPHFGGLWEAAVRSPKVHLLKVAGETTLSPEDFNTLLVQIEGTARLLKDQVEKLAVTFTATATK
ncbi:uncharacterized protein LOC134291174 [Aedes albopictus]|uniref:Integrase zinc-binding domain-containing protein n=1 Tax=Aedes albopictus TaxID=7160 RepID=A0ABM1YDA7_AEDAL